MSTCHLAPKYLTHNNFNHKTQFSFLSPDSLIFLSYSSFYSFFFLSSLSFFFFFFLLYLLFPNTTFFIFFFFDPHHHAISPATGTPKPQLAPSNLWWAQLRLSWSRHPSSRSNFFSLLHTRQGSFLDKRLIFLCYVSQLWSFLNLTR